MRLSTSARQILRRNTRHGGLAIVEFVITVPLVLFVLIATAEIGRAMYQYTALTKAVRDGARWLADQPSGANGVGSVQQFAQPAANLTVFGNVAGTGNPVLPRFTPGNVTVQRVLAGTTPTQFVQVRAVYNFQALFVPIPGLGLGTSDVNAITTLTAVATQRSLN